MLWRGTALLSYCTICITIFLENTGEEPACFTDMDQGPGYEIRRSLKTQHQKLKDSNRQINFTVERITTPKIIVFFSFFFFGKGGIKILQAAMRNHDLPTD